MPLVSILVGNYNYAGYLGQSIESVLKQSYDHWELIICDDGSTDESVSVIEQYARRDRRIRLLTKKNGGHASALNAAFAACRGGLISLLDSDDLYTPSKVKQAVVASHANPQAGLIVHRVLRVDQHRRPRGVWPLSNLPDGWFGPELLSSGGVLPYLPPTSGLTLRREIANILFPLSTVPPLHMCPDQTLMRLAPLITRVAGVSAALAEYRLHSANTYVQRRVSFESVSKELKLTRALWKEQHRFLSLLSPDLAEQLSGVEENVHVSFLRYLAARLGNDFEAHKYHREYVSACERHGRPKWFRLWRLSIYFPAPVFRAVANLVLGPGRLKQLVARMRGLA